MENKLTIAHTAPYLPYGVRFDSRMDKPFEEYGNQPVWTLIGITEMFCDYCLIAKENSDAYAIGSCRLRLRPLSQLTQEIEHNGERFVPVERLEYTYSTLGVRATIEQLAKDNRWVNHCEYLLIQHLLEWHFDTNNLLSDGLAIEKGSEE